MPLWHVLTPVNSVLSVSPTLLHKKHFTSSVCFTRKTDSVTPRQMSAALACGPAAITYVDLVSVF